MVRTGAQYIASLRDGRTVYVNGERVADVTEHPAFHGAVRSIAHLYDLAASPEHRDVMTFPSPSTGEPVNKCFLVPRTAEDLAARRRAHRLWADATFGLMGRSPDHVPGFITGFAMRPDLFARQGQRFADNVVRYHAWLRDADLYAAYVIAPPHIDRSKPAHQQEDPHALRGRGRGARRRHRGQRRPDARHRRRHRERDVHELHRAAGRGRRELRALPRRAGRIAGASPDRAAALRRDRDQRLRLPAVVPLRRDRRAGGLRPGLRPLGAGVRLPGRRADAGAVLRDAGPRARQPPGAGALRQQGAVPGGGGAAHRRVHRRGQGAADPDHARRARQLLRDGLGAGPRLGGRVRAR